MKTFLILLASLIFTVVGCAGQAEVKISNNTSRYVDGDVNGSKFGLVVGGMTTRSVEVGSFFSASSEVDITALIHASSEMTSPIVDRASKTIKLRAGSTYSYEVYYSSGFRTYDLRLSAEEAGSAVLAP